MYDLSAMFSPMNLIGSLIFSTVGFVAFGWGKREGNIKAVLIGIALLIYPYLVPQTWLLYAIGAVLTTALWFCRE